MKCPHVNLQWMFCEGRDSLHPEPLWIIHLESSRAIFIHLVNCHQKSSQTHTAGEKICSKGQIRNFDDRFLERFLSKHSPSDNAKSSRCLWCQSLWLFGVSSGSGEMHKGNSTTQLAIFIPKDSSFYSNHFKSLYFKSIQLIQQLQISTCEQPVPTKGNTTMLLHCSALPWQMSGTITSWCPYRIQRLGGWDTIPATGQGACIKTNFHVETSRSSLRTHMEPEIKTTQKWRFLLETTVIIVNFRLIDLLASTNARPTCFCFFSNCFMIAISRSACALSSEMYMSQFSTKRLSKHHR